MQTISHQRTPNRPVVPSRIDLEVVGFYCELVVFRESGSPSESGNDMGARRNRNVAMRARLSRVAVSLSPRPAPTYIAEFFPPLRE